MRKWLFNKIWKLKDIVINTDGVNLYYNRLYVNRFTGSKKYVREICK